MSKNNVIYAPTVNNFTTTLNGSINATATTVNLNSVTGLQNAAGILVIDRVDSLGNLTPSKQEWIYFNGVSGSSVTLPSAVDGRGVGGSTAQSHADGSIVEAVMDVTTWGGIVTSYTAQHNDAGSHLGVTAQTIGITSNASIAGNVFSNTLNTASTASISGTLNVGNIITKNISVLSLSSIADNTITANSLATGAITLGYAQVTSQINPGGVGTGNTAYDVTGLSVAFTVPAGGRRVKVTSFLPLLRCDGATPHALYNLISNSANTLLQTAYSTADTANTGVFITTIYVATLAAGSYTYKTRVQCSANGSMWIDAGSAEIAFLLVELI